LSQTRGVDLRAAVEKGQYQGVLVSRSFGKLKSSNNAQVNR